MKTHTKLFILSLLSLSLTYYSNYFIGLSTFLLIGAFDYRSYENDKKKNFKRYLTLQAQYELLKNDAEVFSVIMDNGETKEFIAGPGKIHQCSYPGAKSNFNRLNNPDRLFEAYHQNENYSEWCIVDAKFSLQYQISYQKEICLVDGSSLISSTVLKLNKSA